MKKVLVILAEGFEEIEAITPIDIWRRFRMNVTTAMSHPSLDLMVTGQQGIVVKADVSIDNVSHTGFDMIFLPGGSGHKLIASCEKTMSLIAAFAAAGKVVSAICASPTILANAGYLKGLRATCYPTMQESLDASGVLYSASDVVIDGQFITSRGAGTAAKFAFAVIATIDKDGAQKLIENMVFN